MNNGNNDNSNKNDSISRGMGTDSSRDELLKHPSKDETLPKMGKEGNNGNRLGVPSDCMCADRDRDTESSSKYPNGSDEAKYAELADKSLRKLDKLGISSLVGKMMVQGILATCNKEVTNKLKEFGIDNMTADDFVSKDVRFGSNPMVDEVLNEVKELVNNESKNDNDGVLEDIQEIVISKDGNSVKVICNGGYGTLIVRKHDRKDKGWTISIGELTRSLKMGKRAICNVDLLAKVLEVGKITKDKEEIAVPMDEMDELLNVTLNRKYQNKLAKSLDRLKECDRVSGKYTASEQYHRAMCYVLDSISVEGNIAKKINKGYIPTEDEATYLCSRACLICMDKMDSDIRDLD